MPPPEIEPASVSLILIKALLVGVIAVSGLFALRGSRRAYHKVVWRSFMLLVIVVGVASVLFPDSLTSVANALGIGRGADLLLYVSVVTFMLVAVVLYRRLAQLERRYVELARLIALRDAREGLDAQNLGPE